MATQAKRVFAGTHRHGVLVSNDEGSTWQTANDGMSDRYVRSLLSVGASLYAGTDRQGVFRSIDGGVTWTNIRAGLPDSAQVFDLAVVDETLFAALYSKGLYRWNEPDGRWTKTGEISPLELVAIGETLVVGHNPGGAFFSSDLGKTWEDGNTGLPANAPVWTLAANEEVAFVGTTGRLGADPREISVFASRDLGRSWLRSDIGLPPSGAAISFLVTKDFVLVGIVSRKGKGVSSWGEEDGGR